MKLPNLKLNPTSVVKLLSAKFTMILWGFLGIICILTGLIVFREISKVTAVQTDTSGILDRITRVNLQKHKELENRLGENSSFQALPVPGADAFGPAAEKTKQ